jgi:hypothetical protein
MHSYPTGLPRPLREPHGFEPANNLLRTTMQSGRARQRIDFESVPDSAARTWHLSNPQSQLFRAFCKLVGGDWFNMPMSSPEGDIVEVVRFTRTPSGPNRVGLSHWAYSGELEIRERLTATGEEAEILPGDILFSDIFDFTMNRGWPAA